MTNLRLAGAEDVAGVGVNVVPDFVCPVTSHVTVFGKVPVPDTVAVNIV
jgi:hypothetical protein